MTIIQDMQINHMKTKYLFYAAAILGLMVSAVSCLNKESWDMPENEQVPISLLGDIQQQLVTRASDLGFAAGDHVGIWAVNYDEDTPGTLELKGNQATNVRFTFDGTAWASDYDIYYKDKNTKVDLYGIYPYSSAISSIDAWPFEVQEDQSAVSAHGAMGGYEASDFLWAKREAVQPTPNAVQLLFQHKMSCVVVTLEKGTGFADGEFEALGQSVLINNVKRNATINLATGVVTATGAVPSRSTVPAVYENGFRAIVVPQTVSSANSLFTITLGGISYTYSEGAAFTYIAGKQHNFTVTVDKKADGGYAVTVNTTITAWTNDNSSHEFVAKEYVVVNVETPGTLGSTLIASGKSLDKIRNLKIIGKVNVKDFFFMRDNLPILAGVNMQHAKIEAGYGPTWYDPDGENFGDYELYPEDAIPSYAFSRFNSTAKKTLSSFMFPESLILIQSGAFAATSLTGSLVIPSGVTEIQQSAFQATKISSVELPESLTTIGEAAFAECASWVGPLNLPNTLVHIAESAFSGCRGITGPLNLPDYLETLGPNAFSACSGLSGDLVVPTKITVIKPSVFHGCKMGGRLVLHDGITEIGADAFNDNGFKGELLLPKNISVIGNNAFAYNAFSSIPIIPETVTSIGEAAFICNGRLMGVIEIPEDVAVIPAHLFEGCSQLEGIVLPRFISSIGENAFRECFQLNSIICDATEPPVVQNGAFDGVPKDNFAVEVPESSMNQYVYANGWKEFKRITAHREFSISRNSFKSLNHGDSRQFIIRALSDASWSVESKPDWITVTPSSGTGKTDVTVTFSDLAPGAGNRDGQVVFLLDGKDYRSSMTVAQFDYTYGDGDVITIQAHSEGTGIPIVFLGDCYDAADIANNSYLSDTQEAISYFFDIEPYKTYQDYFDVYIVFGKSEDSGVGTVNTIREAKFGTQYSLTGGALENDGTVAFQYAKKADANMDLTKSLVVMVLNSTDYGGVTYMWGDGSAIAICPKSTDPYPYDFRGLVQHEAGGHGFGKLADEYIYTNAFIQACSCGNPHLNEFMAGKANGWYKNLSETSVRDMVPWSHLMYHPSYSNTVDIYEGGYFHTRGIYRSEPNSCMNNNIPYYSAISRQAIVERIMDYAGLPFNLEDFYTNDAIAIGTRAAVERSPYWTPTSSNSTNSKHHEPVIMGEHPIY